MLKNDLITLGLSEKEAKVYLALLELGKSTAQVLAKKAGVNRATAYFVLRSLMRLGIIGEMHDHKTAMFVAESPERLGILLRRKEEEVEVGEKLLEKILPELRSVYNLLEKKPVVRYFDGPEGPRLMRDDILKRIKDDTIYNFSDYDAIEGVFTKEENEIFRNKKRALGIKTEAILTSRTLPGIHEKGVEAIALNPAECEIFADISIYGDTVQISKVFSATNFGVITITDKGIAQTLKSLFKLAWKSVRVVSDAGFAKQLGDATVQALNGIPDADSTKKGGGREEKEKSSR